MAFVVAAKVSEIPPGRVKTVEIGEEDIALCNVEGLSRLLISIENEVSAHSFKESELEFEPSLSPDVAPHEPHWQFLGYVALKSVANGFQHDNPPGP